MKLVSIIEKCDFEIVVFGVIADEQQCLERDEPLSRFRRRWAHQGKVVRIILDKDFGARGGTVPEMGGGIKRTQEAAQMRNLVLDGYPVVPMFCIQFRRSRDDGQKGAQKRI